MVIRNVGQLTSAIHTLNVGEAVGVRGPYGTSFPMEELKGKSLLYITGGIGASRHGEAFGENYVLPNLTAYSETCAAIGSVYWNHRLFMMTGEVKYYDVEVN